MKRVLRELGFRKCLAICLLVIGVAAITASVFFDRLFVWFWPDKSEVIEHVPPFVRVEANASEIKTYATEFAGKSMSPQRQIPANWKDIRETNAAFLGYVLYVVPMADCEAALIQTYSGQSWMTGQKLYFRSFSTNVQELTSFVGKIVRGATLLALTNCENLYVLAAVKEDGYEGPLKNNFWAGSILRYQVSTGRMERLSAGYEYLVSPDHTRALVMRGNSEGYHSFHLLHINSGQVEDVISMWESDPHSGTSWRFAWSDDSKAICFRGATIGFGRKQDDHVTNFRLIHVVSEKKTYSLPADKPYYKE